MKAMPIDIVEQSGKSVRYLKISDHQQSWRYEDGPSKGPGSHALLVIADF
jgi:hypothetical protein